MGYPIEIFSDKEISISKFLCAICDLVLRNAVQGYCGHRYCMECAENYIINVSNPVCPMCEKDEGLEEPALPLKSDQLFVDNALKREMGRMMVRCYLDHCDWLGNFQSLEDHTTTCRKVLLTCRTCKQSIQKEEMSSHEKIHDHDQHFCKFGCGIEVKESNMSEHMLEFDFAHLNSLFDRMQQIYILIGANSNSADESKGSILDRVSNLEQFMRDFEIKLKQLSTHGVSAGSGKSNSFIQEGCMTKTSLDLKLAEIEEKMSVYEGVMTVLNRELEKLVAHLEKSEDVQKADRELIATMDRKIKSLERQMAMKDSTIAELELRTTALELTSYDGTLVWKIADFSRKRQEAVSGRTPSIYSTPFYTSKTGYKMCARIYLNGDGMGRGTHVSLFFVIMRGQYDAMLKWPFRQKVTLLFLDQNNREHVLDAFRPDPTSSSFKRPVSEMNIASGCPLFLSHSKLEDLSQGYVKDNTAFIKLIVNIDDV